jgi:putative DNA primase/helicase
MTAETIAKALRGRRAGAAWMANCPAQEREPSLSIKDAHCGKVLVHCHAGCDQKQVIAALKARGIWRGTDRRHSTLISPQPNPVATDELDDGAKRTKAALRRSGATVPANGTLVETYFSVHAASLCRYQPRYASRLGSSIPAASSGQ